MRVLALQPSVSLVLEALDRLEVLVGCTRYCLEQVPSLRGRGLAVVKDSWSSETGEIVALRPDLVIASVPYRSESLAAILKAGLPVLALAPHSLEDIYGDIQLIGSVVGEPARAFQVISGMQAAVAGIAAIAAAASHRPLVYCEEWGKPLIHSQRWVQQLVEAAGGSFLGDAGKVTTAEAIAAANPEVMVFSWCGAGSRVPVERVLAKRGWNHLLAGQTGRAVCIADELLNSPATNLVAGIEALAAVIHPKLFVPAESLTGEDCIVSSP